MREVIIWGAGKIAEVLFDYVSKDSDLVVRGFCVDAEYADRETFCKLPLVSFKDAQTRFPPSRYGMLMGIGYHSCNALRRSRYQQAVSAGYQLATYVSSRAWVAESAKIGAGCVILDQVSVEPGVTLGDNVALWSNVTIGHHSQVGSHAWLAAGASVGGSACIGDACFLGLNATVGHEVELGERCLVGGTAWVSKSQLAGSVLIAPDATLFRLDIERFLQFNKLL